MGPTQNLFSQTNMKCRIYSRRKSVILIGKMPASKSRSLPSFRH